MATELEMQEEEEEAARRVARRGRPTERER